MQLLFEDYFNDAIDFSRDMYKNLQGSSRFYPDNEDILYSISDDPPINVIFVRKPHMGMQTAMAGFYTATKGKRSTVVLKNGKKARRMLVIGGEMAINVANIIMKYRHLFPSYKQLAPYIIETKKKSYTISDDVSALKFAIITKELIKTNFFKHIFAHEIQHFYNPWVHKRAESHRKVDTDMPLTQKQQRNLNYHRSNAEVDSSTVEAATRVINNADIHDLFDQNTPENQKNFIEACMGEFIINNVWNVYPQWLKRKIIKRWAKIYQHEIQRRHLDEQEKLMNRWIKTH